MIDELGDRMKGYEGSETNRIFLPLIPIIARIDGRGFSGLTRYLDKPYDKRFSDAMIKTAKYLLKETNADCAFVQSDEITLTWNQTHYLSQYFFGGKIFKMTSVIASMASVAFLREMNSLAREDSKYALIVTKLPHFDCRVFQVPNITEGANCFLWRYKDCTRNAITGVAQQHFSHKELNSIDTKTRLKMLEDKGIIIDKDYPPEFLHGTFLRWGVEDIILSKEQIDKMPEMFKPIGGTVPRPKITIEHVKF